MCWQPELFLQGQQFNWRSRQLYGSLCCPWPPPWPGAFFLPALPQSLASDSVAPSASRELLEIRISSAAKKKERKKGKERKKKTITTGKIQEEALWGGRNIQRKWKAAEQKCFHIAPCTSESEALLCSPHSCTRAKSARLMLLGCDDSSSKIKGRHVGGVALEIWRSRSLLSSLQTGENSNIKTVQHPSIDLSPPRLWLDVKLWDSAQLENAKRSAKKEGELRVREAWNAR